jgi:hypothetical protein
MSVDGWFEMDLETREVRLTLGETRIRCHAFGDRDERDFTIAESRSLLAMLDRQDSTIPPARMEPRAALSELLHAYDSTG